MQSNRYFVAQSGSERWRQTLGDEVRLTYDSLPRALSTMDTFMVIVSMWPGDETSFSWWSGLALTLKLLEHFRRRT
ncbi:hypothetical protein P8605_14315 [Streptomyces sp. T-3]|nr:hypothetical protein [Streptomyces sp. T-3]